MMTLRHIPQIYFTIHTKDLQQGYAVCDNEGEWVVEADSKCNLPDAEFTSLAEAEAVLKEVLEQIEAEGNVLLADRSAWAIIAYTKE